MARVDTPQLTVNDFRYVVESKVDTWVPPSTSDGLADVVLPPGWQQISSAEIFTDSRLPKTHLYYKQVQEATLRVKPVRGCPVRIFYVLETISPGHVKLFTNLHELHGKLVGGTDDPTTISLLNCYDAWHGKVQEDDVFAELPALAHCAVSLLHPGEVAQVLWQGEDGALPAEGHLKGDDSPWVRFTVGIVDWGDPLPPIRSRAEVVAEDRRAALEEKERFEAEPPPPITERLRQALQAKDDGNTAVKCGNFVEAKAAYNRGMAKSFVSTEELRYSSEFSGVASAKNSQKVEYVKCTLLLNRSYANMKLGLLDDAIWDAEQTLSMSSRWVSSLLPMASAVVSNRTLLDASSAIPPEAFAALKRKASFRYIAALQSWIDGELRKAARRSFWDEDLVTSRSTTIMEALKQYAGTEGALLDCHSLTVLFAFRSRCAEATVLSAKAATQEKLLAAIQTREERALAKAARHMFGGIPTVSQEKARTSADELDDEELPPLDSST